MSNPPSTDFESRLSALEQTVNDLRFRNINVDTNKAWETSFTRRSFIALLTFVFTSLVFKSIGVPDPFFNALIPTVGFIVSTFSLPWIKSRWITSLSNKR